MSCRSTFHHPHVVHTFGGFTLWHRLVMFCWSYHSISHFCRFNWARNIILLCVCYFTDGWGWRDGGGTISFCHWTKGGNRKFKALEPMSGDDSASRWREQKTAHLIEFFQAVQFREWKTFKGRRHNLKKFGTKRLKLNILRHNLKKFNFCAKLKLYIAYTKFNCTVYRLPSLTCFSLPSISKFFRRAWIYEFFFLVRKAKPLMAKFVCLRHESAGNLGQNTQSKKNKSIN